MERITKVKVTVGVSKYNKDNEPCMKINFRYRNKDCVALAPADKIKTRGAYRAASEALITSLLSFDNPLSYDTARLVANKAAENAQAEYVAKVIFERGA